MRRLALMCLLLVLSACAAATVPSQVVRFHDLSSAGGLRFVVYPDESQRGSLEFESYAQQTARALERYGYKPVPSLRDNPDLVVLLRYGVDNGRTELRVSPLGGRVGWDSPGVGGRYDVFPPSPTESYAVFTRRLEMDIVDGSAYRDGATRKRFEGRALSEGVSRALPPVMPYLIAAMFDGFPGISGQAVIVRVPQQTGR